MESRSLNELWARDVAELGDEELRQLSEWRGWALEFCRLLRNESAIGLHRYQGQLCWAFPVYDEGRQLVSIHFRVDSSSLEKKATWRYEPAGKPVHPLLRGSLAPGCKRCFLLESTWDALACEALLDSEIASSCIVATRGAANAQKTLNELVLPPQCEVVAIPQNDEAGTKWLQTILEHFGRLLVARVSKEVKDLNDWQLRGHGAPDFQQLLEAIEILEAGDLPTEVFTLSGRSLYDFLDIAVDPTSNLLGNRWLTREGSLFVVAPSGHGKSSFSIQCAINWAIGRVAFGIKPARPLKILLLESEDDEADNKSFVQIIRTMALTEKEKELLIANTRLEFRRDLSGERFFCAIDQFLAQYQPDILLVNPLTGFCTIELKDELGMNDFLRNRLNALMVKHRCAPIIVAHMPKGQVSQITDKQWYEWMYVLSGCVTLTNWARAILVFVPSKIRGTYRFITAKRFTQSGWLEPEYYFAHSTKNIVLNDQDFEVIQWIAAQEAQIKEAKPEPKTKKIIVTSELIHDKMSPLDGYSRESFRAWCKETFGIGRDASDDFRSLLIQNGLIKIIEGEGKGSAKTRTFFKIPK